MVHANVSSGSTQTGASPLTHRLLTVEAAITANTMTAMPVYQYTQCRLSGAYSSARQVRSRYGRMTKAPITTNGSTVATLTSRGPAVKWNSVPRRRYHQTAAPVARATAITAATMYLTDCELVFRYGRVRNAPSTVP